MTEKYEQLRQVIREAEVDIDKCYNKGNKSAGIRARRKMKQVKLLAHEIRMEILNKGKRKV